MHARTRSNQCQDGTSEQRERGKELDEDDLMIQTYMRILEKSCSTNQAVDKNASSSSPAVSIGRCEENFLLPTLLAGLQIRRFRIFLKNLSIIRWERLC